MTFLPYKKIHAIWLGLLNLVLVSLTQVCLAQLDTAELEVTVSDPSGAAVSGAKVRVENSANGFLREVTTGEEGKARLLALPPGTYTIRVEARGFKRVEIAALPLTVGQHAQVLIRLQVSPLSQALDVLVAAANSVETTRHAVSTTIDQTAIENLPSNGRNYINFTLLDSAATRDNQPILAPAPTSGLNINGQRARANMVSIDGVDAIDNTVNGVRATLSQEAVQEFQIIKSGYAPEYGRAASAVINIVSKQGGNQWRGDLFGYLRNRHVSATNAFAGEPDPGDTRTQAGFTFGGPIRRDKTFAFLSFDWSALFTAALREACFNMCGVMKIRTSSSFRSRLSLLNSQPRNGMSISQGIPLTLLVVVFLVSPEITIVSPS